MVLAVIVPATLVLLAAAAAGGGSTANHGSPQPASHGVPFASGGRPIWPIHPSSDHRSHHTVSYKDVSGRWHGRSARSFAASRDNGRRHHAGIDLFANPGDIVVAPDNGVVVGRQSFYAGTGAMLVEIDGGPVVLLGEVKMGGAAEFGVDVGSRVEKGQPLTRVGLMDGGSHMLHFETYLPGTRRNFPWYRAAGRPDALLDPSAYLLTARANSQRIDAAVA